MVTSRTRPVRRVIRDDSSGDETSGLKKAMSGSESEDDLDDFEFRAPAKIKRTRKPVKNVATAKPKAVMQLTSQTDGLSLASPIRSSPADVQAKAADGLDPDEELVESAQQSLTPKASNPIPSPVVVTKPPPQGPQPRLVIDKMVLINFKSYAGRQIIGPFHRSFSSVVGPNGSGKSNVIDALLFVFGYRASKMRQGKLSELIHNSEGLQSLDSCSVEIHFCQILDGTRSDEFQQIPGSELVVSRQAQRNNSSRYFINGQSSNYTEVTTLLKERGIDLEHKRFLILQGEVESISQMPSKARNEHEDGLLEYLEDIIGTNVYKASIEQANLALDELNEDRSVKLARVRVTEEEMSSLDDRRQKALEFKRLDNDLKGARSKLWQIYIRECAQNVEILSSNVEHYRGQLAKEAEEHKGLDEEVSQLEKQYESSADALKEKKAKAADWSKQLAALEKNDINLQERKKHLETKLKKLIKTDETNTHALAEARSWITNHNETVATLTIQQTKLESKLESEEAALDAVRDSLRDKTEPFSQAIAKKEAELAPWLQKIGLAKASQDVIDAEAKHIQDRVEASKETLIHCEQAYEELQQNLSSKTAEAKDLQANEQEAQGRHRDLKDEIAQGEVELARLQQRRDSLRSKLDEARQTQSAANSKTQILSSLNALQQAGKLKGFHGRLGDLGTISEKYDVAISTACPALDNLVVDNVEIGQKCVAHIRSHGLGRAVFILLDQLPERNLGKIQTPKNAPRLFDLVTVKNETYQAAFYSVLQNTLVAHDLDEANTIAYQGSRWRVVTINGQLIDKSGTMSGGGTRVARGGMSSSGKVGVSVHDLQAMAQEMSELDEKIARISKLLQQQAEQVERLQDEASASRMSLSKITLERDTYHRQCADLEIQLKEARGNVMEDPTLQKHLADLQSRSRKAAEERERLQGQSAYLEAAIKSLQDKILEIGGMQLRTQKAKVDSAKEQLEHTSQQISTSQMASVKACKDAERLQKLLETNTAETDKINQQLATLAEEIAQHRSTMKENIENNKETQKALDTHERAMKEKRKVLEKERLKLLAIRAVEVDIRSKLDDSEKALKDAHAKNYDDDEEAFEVQTYTDDELEAFSRDQLKAEIAILEERTQKANPNLSVLAEYKKREQEFSSRAQELEGTTRERDQAKALVEGLMKRRLEEFMSGFVAISLKLKEMYQMITMGGNAELELVDSMDPFSEGIVFSVMPPKKSWKNISNLSGGEKTLSSLALVFALHHFKPTPIYVMDEIDAALDFRNVSVVANYIKERNKNGQFIIISLRNNMFELASRLVGIYKTHNQTKSISLDNRPIAGLATA